MQHASLTCSIVLGDLMSFASNRKKNESRQHENDETVESHRNEEGLQPRGRHLHCGMVKSIARWRFGVRHMWPRLEGSTAVRLKAVLSCLNAPCFLMSHSWFVPNGLMNPQPNHSPGTSRTPKRRRAGRREAAASLHEARSMVLARPWRRQRARFLLQQDQNDSQPWWPWLWATSLKRRRSCGDTWCKKWVDHHAADGETKDRSTMHSNAKLAQILSQATKFVSIAMSSAKMIFPQDRAKMELRNVELISKKNRNHVVVRFLQHQNVPRPSNEQLHVVGSVAIYKRACSHNSSLFPLLSWWCNGLPFPDNRSPNLGAGGNVSMDGTTDRFFLAGIRRERVLRLHVTKQKRQQKITGGNRLSFWYAEWAVDQAAGQHVQYLCMWRHRNLTCPIIPILWKRSSRLIPLLPHRLHCESCEHGRVNWGDQRMLCHSKTWKQRWSEAWVPTCYHWLSLSCIWSSPAWRLRHITHDWVLVLHECKQSFRFLILTKLHSGFVNRTTECISPLFCHHSEFARHLAWLSKHDTIVLPGDVYEFKIPFDKMLAGIYFQTRGEEPIDKALALAQLRFWLANVHMFPVLAVARILLTAVMTRLQDVGGHLCKNCRVHCVHDFEFPGGCVTVLVLQSRNFLQNNIQLQSLIRPWHDRLELIVISNFERFLGCDYFCTKNWTVSINDRFFIGNVKVSFFRPFWQIFSSCWEALRISVSCLSVCCSNESPQTCGIACCFLRNYCWLLKVRDRFAIRPPLFSVWVPWCSISRN